MNFAKNYHFLNGRFEWDDYVSNGLIFISNEAAIQDETVTKKLGNKDAKFSEIGFRDDVDLTDKMIFRKFFQRKCEHIDADVICLQDVKDVVIFTANPDNLTMEFLNFFHIQTVDRFLRAIIIYFQLFFLVYNKLIKRRKLINNKVRQPIVTVLENITRDDLADLRSMISREYSNLLVGAFDCKKYHFKGDRERRLIEMLCQMSTRVVWMALHRPNLSIIEREIERLIKTEHFNSFEHEHVSKICLLHENECRVLRGSADIPQKRLMTQSPLIKEVIYIDHDYRMMATGQLEFPPPSKRQKFFQNAYLLPEEFIANSGMCIGILGMRRDNFDVTLKRKRKRGLHEDVAEELIFHFDIPREIHQGTRERAASKHSIKSLPSLQPIFDREQNTLKQCNLWKNWVEKCTGNKTTDELPVTCSALTLL